MVADNGEQIQTRAQTMKEKKKRRTSKTMKMMGNSSSSSSSMRAVRMAWALGRLFPLTMMSMCPVESKRTVRLPFFFLPLLSSE